MIDLIPALNLAADDVWAVGVDVALKATLLFLVALLLHRLLHARHPVACSSIWNAYLVGLALLPLAAVACPRLRIECLPPDLAVTEARAPAVTGKSVNPPPAPMDGETAHSPDWQFEQANVGPFVPAQGTQIPHETSAGEGNTFAVAVAEVGGRQSVQWKTWFLATYFIGVMIAAVRLALSFRAVKSLRRSSVALTEPSWIDALRGWCRRLAIGHSVRLAHSGEIGTAIVLGWLRPVIVMPRAMLSAITPGQRNVILVHELAHIRRADFAWQWLLRVLQVVYWLHPLCWVTDRAIRSVRERICDDFCVHWLGNRREYQTALVDLAGTMARRQDGLAMGLAAAGSSKIEQRLAHIDESSGCLRCRPRWQFRTLLLGVAAGLTMLLGSVELCRVDLTAGEVAAERTEPLTVAGEPSDKTPAGGYKLMGEPPLLCVECDPSSAERQPAAPAGTGSPGTETFIVSFKGIDPFRPRTANDLLHGFANRHEDGARTHHFRTTKKDGALVGHICVDGKAGKDSLVSLLAENDRVTLVDCREATPDVLELHMALGHTSRRTNRSRQSTAAASRAKPSYPGGETRLRFELSDAFGRKVHSDDYLGAPVLILAGGCWCGGCQADAERVRAIEEKYRARGLRVIRSTSLDNELPAWEFQKHYRLPFVQMLDPIREFEKRYNDDGWTFLMLADGEGRTVYRGNSGNLDYSHVEGLLDTLLARRSAVETVTRDGVSYMPATLKRSGELDNLRPDARFASVACSAEGRTYVAFTTNHGGTQDVYLREFDGQKWLPDRPVAATEADEFDGTVIVDREDRVWVSWTSNGGGSHYDVHVVCTSDSSSISAPVQVTNSHDDAMHARMASDAQGRIWVTYYKWHKMHGCSRDKEVYARCLEDGRWSDEIRVSPTDVPEAEDHFDPVIAAYEDGVIVGWSWDFHPQNSSSYSAVSKLPSIFLRTVGPAAELGPVRAVSGPNADTRPAIARRGDGRICCVWESVVHRGGSDPGYQKIIAGSVEDLGRDQEPGTGMDVTGFKRNICTPCLAASPSGDVASVWSEVDDRGRWELKFAILDGRTARWAQPKTVVSSDHNARFPAAAFDADGRLWIAYSTETGEGRGIQVVKHDPAASLDRQSQRHGDQSAATAAPSEPRQMLLQAREALRGKDKNTRLAQDLLLDLAENYALDFKPLDRCCLYVYLAYIEDLGGNREAAVGWHEKALSIEGLRESGIRRVAELGKSEAVIWLRHLDMDVPPPSRDASKARVIERIGEAVITSGPPADPAPLKMELSTDERLENFDLLWQAIDRNYSFFEHKGIDWDMLLRSQFPQDRASSNPERRAGQ